MNLRFTLEPTTLDAIGDLREQHLDGLPEAIDALVEILVRSARPHRIRARGETIGYVVVDDRRRMLELHVRQDHEVYAHDLFPQILERLDVGSALVQTFDALFLACALDEQASVSMRGALTRHYFPRALPSIDRIRYDERPAELRDVPQILATDQDVFIDEARLRGAVERNEVVVFEHDEALVGFGLMRVLHPDRPHVEVGIAVDAPFRNKGYAIYMLRDMVEHCVARGLEPICGLSRDNEASIRMGSRIGLVSRYRLIELHFGDA